MEGLPQGLLDALTVDQVRLPTDAAPTQAMQRTTAVPGGDVMSYLGMFSNILGPLGALVNGYVADQQRSNAQHIQPIGVRLTGFDASHSPSFDEIKENLVTDLHILAGDAEPLPMTQASNQKRTFVAYFHLLSDAWREKMVDGDTQWMQALEVAQYSQEATTDDGGGIAVAFRRRIAATLVQELHWIEDDMLKDVFMMYGYAYVHGAFEGHVVKAEAACGFKTRRIHVFDVLLDAGLRVHFSNVMHLNNIVLGDIYHTRYTTKKTLGGKESNYGDIALLMNGQSLHYLRGLTNVGRKLISYGPSGY